MTANSSRFNSSNHKAFDIIGDIHGHADALERLLQQLGYRRKAGVYQHAGNRQAIFVGDFIDRGPKIRETLHLVKDMCDAGHALAVMGNHEFNAICFHTPHVERGGFFREHSWKEINQHMATMDQFKHYRQEWLEFVEWFKQLPIWLDEPAFRVVHACWDDAHIALLVQQHSPMNAEFLTQATDPSIHPALYNAIQDVLKGKEMPLPNGLQITDKDGAVRTNCRIRWWAVPGQTTTYGDYLLGCPESLKQQALPKQAVGAPGKGAGKPIFFGHYWLSGEPVVSNPAAICLDYSIARGGRLVAYSLDTEKFTWVAAN